MNITTHDLMRIAMEQTLIVDDEEPDGHRDAADQWAASRGMEQGTMAMVANSVSYAYEQGIIELSREYGVDENDTIEVDGGEFVAAHPKAVSHAMEITILSAFRWGFEAAVQFHQPNIVGEEE